MKGCMVGEHLVNTLVNTFLLLVNTLHTLSIYIVILIKINIYNKLDNVLNNSILIRLYKKTWVSMYAKCSLCSPPPRKCSPKHTPSVHQSVHHGGHSI